MNEIPPMIAEFKAQIENQSRCECLWLTVPLSVPSMIGLNKQFRLIQQHLRKHPPAPVIVHAPKRLAASMLDVLADALIDLHLKNYSEQSS